MNTAKRVARPGLSLCLTVGLLLAGASVPACTSQKATSEEVVRRERLDTLVSHMTGSFASTEQARTDPEYFDIRLHMTPIWPERTDGRWLLVEQAMAEAMDKPYRQRVYRVTANADGTFRSEVYEFADPAVAASVVGAWNDPARAAGLRFEQVVLKPGCEVTLTYHFCRELFTGTTGATTCPSTLRGASYATSEVSVNAAGIYSWDRGFDAEGKQVWGAKRGGYYFVKQRAGG